MSYTIMTQVQAQAQAQVQVCTALYFKYTACT